MNKLTVFFDGKCVLCFREIKHYKKLDKKGLIRTIDITAGNFSAKEYGLENRPIEISIHSKDDQGEIFTGVETFAEIWKRVYPYKKLSFILENKSLRPFFNFGYKVFAHKIRPHLPKRDCENDNCEILL